MLKVYAVEVRGVEGQCCKIVELLFNRGAFGMLLWIYIRRLERKLRRTAVLLIHVRCLDNVTS